MAQRLFHFIFFFIVLFKSSCKQSQHTQSWAERDTSRCTSDTHTHTLRKLVVQEREREKNKMKQPLGHRHVFLWYLPTSFFFLLAQICEIVHWMFACIGVSVEPFLTRTEVYKIGIPHYFSMQRANSCLGYKPVVSAQEGVARTVKYFREQQQQQQALNAERSSSNSASGVVGGLAKFSRLHLIVLLVLFLCLWLVL